MLGVALGCIRLSYDDFCKMDFEDFAAVYNAYMEQRDADFKDRWERVRWLAFLSVQPHIDHKKAGKLTPQKLLHFAWDEQPHIPEPKPDAPKMTKEQQRERMKQLAEKFGDEMI